MKDLWATPSNRPLSKMMSTGLTDKGGWSVEARKARSQARPGFGQGGRKKSNNPVMKSLGY